MQSKVEMKSLKDFSLSDQTEATSTLNLALLDPPRWGWCAVGGIVDLSTPHERARRISSRHEFLEMNRKRQKISEGDTVVPERSNHDIVVSEKIPTPTTNPPDSTGQDGHTALLEIQNDSQIQEQQKEETIISTNSIQSSMVDRLNESKQENGMDTRNDDEKLESMGSTQKDTAISEPVSDSQQPNLLEITSDPTSGSQLDGDFSTTQQLLTVNETQTTDSLPTIHSHNFPILKPSSMESFTNHQPHSTQDHQVVLNQDSRLAIATRNQQGKSKNDMSAPPTKADRPVNKYALANVEDTHFYELSKVSNNGRAKKGIKVKSVDEQDRLNMFAYHRGIAGYEPRELNSGRLVCDVEPTDTNYTWVDPHLKCPVTITIPLGVSNDGTQHYYSENMEWDLANPTTKSPLVFATDIAGEYGLTPAQTLDLASSIQKQMDQFLRRFSCYRIPITLNDPTGVERTDDQLKQLPGFLYPKTLYGGCNATSITPLVQSTTPIQPSALPDPIQTTKSRKTSSSSSMNRKNPQVSVSGGGESCFKGSKDKRAHNQEIPRKKSSESKIQFQLKDPISPSTIFQNNGIAKIPTFDFPRELDGIYDADPSQPDDYRTQFTSNGPVVLSEHCPYPDRYEFVIAEQVYEDFEPAGECAICHQLGPLMIRCKKCPRLFHRECLDKEVGQDWTCLKCLEDDLSVEVNGSNYIELLANCYLDYATESDYTQNIGILSTIVAIIDFLVGYDFGDVFAIPVDLEEYAEYAKKIKNPRDLGTIKNSVLNGLYRDKSSSESCDDLSRMNFIVLETLKDIETVWFNCLSYNVEGSVVKRAGDLQMRKFRAISLNYVENVLNAQVKEKLVMFRSLCAQILSDEYREKERRLRPISNRSLRVMRRGKKAVAIFDPETSMVVKLYCSVKNAYAVFQFLEKIGHTPGCETLDEQSFSEQVKKFTASSDKRFFGYQWLMMENLRFLKRKAKQIAEKQPLSNEMNILKPIPYVPKEVGSGQTATVAGTAKYMKLEKLGACVPLAVFDSFEYAAVDWFECYKHQLKDGQPLDDDWREIFQSSYLDSELTVDGMLWRSVQVDSSSSAECMEPDGHCSETSA